MKTVLVILPLLILVSAAASAPEEAATLKVEKTPMRGEVAVRGTFLPPEATSVVPRPEGWRGRYVVEWAMEPGSEVTKGTVVLRFDKRAINDALDDARFDMAHAERDHEMELRRLAFRAQTAEWDMKRKERDYEAAVRRMEDYRTYEKPRTLARAELDRKGQDQGLKNAEEELRQLEKMYDEDELVDDTEEIVLERSRWNLERRRKMHEWWVQARKWTDDVTRPRWEEQMAFDLEQKTAAIERTREEYRMGKASLEMSLARALRNWEKKKRDLARLEHVLSTMEIKAPADGILLHGPLLGATGRAFKAGDQANAEAAVVSIVAPGRLIAKLAVPVKEALRIAPGAAVRIQPDVTGAPAIETTIARMSRLPKGGNFEAICDIPSGTSPALLGTGGAVKIVLEETKDVLTVPASAVFRSGNRAFCLTADGLVAVKTGREAGGRVEILGGLAEGAEILPAPPEAKK